MPLEKVEVGSFKRKQLEESEDPGQHHGGRQPQASSELGESGTCLLICQCFSVTVVRRGRGPVSALSTPTRICLYNQYNRRSTLATDTSPNNLGAEALGCGQDTLCRALLWEDGKAGQLLPMHQPLGGDTETFPSSPILTRHGRYPTAREPGPSARQAWGRDQERQDVSCSHMFYSLRPQGL